MSSRITLFIPTLECGGAERVMLSLADGFASRGNRVDLLLVKASGQFLGMVPSHVNIVDLGASRALASLPRLVRYLRRRKPDVVLSTLDHTNMVCLIANIVSGRKSRIVVRQASTLTSEIQYSSKVRTFFNLMAMRLTYKFADNIIVVSKGAATEFCKALHLEQSRVTVIHNPAIDRKFQELAREPSGHPWLDAKSSPVILGVGRLSHEKDYACLLRAFSRVRQSREARLVVIGEGDQRSSLEDLARQLGVSRDVDMPGFRNNPYSFLAKADVFVLSSLYEGLPNSLIQAMAVGIPVVSTNCKCGPAEILEDGKYGTLVPVGDAEALALAIEKVLTQKMDAESQRICRRASLSRFDYEYCVDQYLKAISV